MKPCVAYTDLGPDEREGTTRPQPSGLHPTRPASATAIEHCFK